MEESRKLKLKRRMATALSVQDYLTYFLLKNDAPEAKAEGKERSQGLLLIATVHKRERDGDESIIYSRRMIGGKNADPVALMVQELTGNTDTHINGGNLIRTSSLMDLHSDCETQLPRNCTVNIDILASRSPSKVGSEELQRLLEHCKRNSIKVTVQFTFGHPFSWDNKYNREGIKLLCEKGVKMRPLSFQQGLSMMVNDVQDTLETLDELQTCRGTICVNYYMLKRAITKFRDALIVQSDRYHQENEEKLKEILGYKNTIPTCKAGHQHKLKSFSLATNRDYFFLQNSDEIWAKIDVNLIKFKDGVTQEESLFEDVYNAAEPAHDKRLTKNDTGKNPFCKEKVDSLVEKLWKLIGDNITLSELASQDEIVVRVSFVISEYPDRLGWWQAINTLHRHLAERLHDTAMKKVRAETTIRYAMNMMDSSSPGSTSGRSTPSTTSGQSSKVEADRDHAGVTTECMHIQDILFDMLEDLEDNLLQLGAIDFGRGANLKVDKSMLSSAMGLLNKATTIRTEGGKVYSMNSDFSDIYSESINQS